VATVEIRSLPIVGEHEFFVTCEEERHRARTEAQTGTDDQLRFEATMMVTHLLQWQISSAPDLVEQLKEMSSYDPRRQQVLDWIREWTENATRELEEWAAFQDAMVDHIGRDIAERIASERVEPRLEGVKDSARGLVIGKARELAADHGIDFDALGADERESALSAEPAAAPTSTTAAADPEMKACPDCAEEVKAAARKCRFCGYRFDSEPQ
jgi:hypothetical protein